MDTYQYCGVTEIQGELFSTNFSHMVTFRAEAEMIKRYQRQIVNSTHGIKAREKRSRRGEFRRTNESGEGWNFLASDEISLFSSVRAHRKKLMATAHNPLLSLVFLLCFLSSLPGAWKQAQVRQCCLYLPSSPLPSAFSPPLWEKCTVATPPPQ